jgi:hypothetical protein
MKPDDIRARIETLKFALQTHGVDLAPYVTPGAKAAIRDTMRNDIVLQMQRLKDELKAVA